MPWVCRKPNVLAIFNTALCDESADAAALAPFFFAEPQPCATSQFGQRPLDILEAKYSPHPIYVGHNKFVLCRLIQIQINKLVDKETKKGQPYNKINKWTQFEVNEVVVRDDAPFSISFLHTSPQVSLFFFIFEPFLPWMPTYPKHFVTSSRN